MREYETGSSCCCFYGQGGKQPEVCCEEESVGVWEGFVEDAVLCEDAFLCEGGFAREGAYVALLRGVPVLLCTLSFDGPAQTGKRDCELEEPP